MKRKIIQLIRSHSGAIAMCHYYALCDDGTLWTLDLYNLNETVQIDLSAITNANPTPTSDA